jgi:hypothetical protein
MTSMRTIKLSKMEVAYLANTRFLPEDLAQILRTAEKVGDEARLLKLSGEIAERFRDVFTTRLAKFGFGPDYEPTREGKLLENLIDRFAAES